MMSNCKLQIPHYYAKSALTSYRFVRRILGACFNHGLLERPVQSYHHLWCSSWRDNLYLSYGRDITSQTRYGRRSVWYIAISFCIDSVLMHARLVYI